MQPNYSRLDIMTGNVLFLTSNGKTLRNKKTGIVNTNFTINSSFEDTSRLLQTKGKRGRAAVPCESETLLTSSLLPRPESKPSPFWYLRITIIVDR